jgi:hypothetical protein
MKDCGYTLRKAYFDKLASASYSLSVYDTIAPDTVEPPFLIISSQTQVDNSNKQSFSFDVTIQFDIVYTTFKAGEVGQKTVDTYANELLGIIGVRPPSYPNTAPDFKIVTCKVGSNNATFDYVNEVYVFRRVITMDHFVNQLT